MKKVLLIIGAIILSNCELKVKESKAQTDAFYAVYKKDYLTEDGMKYMLLYVRDQSSQTGYSITTINITKDKLEIELLQKQLKQLK